MKAEEFLKVMKVLGTAYNKDFTKEQVEVWYSFFRDEDITSFKKATTRLISTEVFMPSIARVRQEIAQMKTPALQRSPEDAWESVLTAIRKYGYYDSKNAMDSLDPVTQRCVRQLGGFQKVCTSEEGDWLRKNFVELYKELSSNTEKVMQLSEPTMTQAELLAKAQAKVAEIEQRKMLGEASNGT